MPSCCSILTVSWMIWSITGRYCAFISGSRRPMFTSDQTRKLRPMKSHSALLPRIFFELGLPERGIGPKLQVPRRQFTGLRGNAVFLVKVGEGFAEEQVQAGQPNGRTPARRQHRPSPAFLRRSLKFRVHESVVSGRSAFEAWAAGGGVGVGPVLGSLRVPSCASRSAASLLAQQRHAN